MIAFIDDHRGAHGVEPICKVLPIAPSTYRDHVAKRADPAKLSARAKRDLALKPEIERVFAENFEVYGARKVWRQLNREDVTVARCTVERLMVDLGLQGVIRGKPVRTTVQDKTAPCPLDHVNRVFHAPAPNRLWLSDFTYVSTWSGFVYVAFVIDAYARRIVGWRVSRTAHASFVLDALEQALHERRPVQRGGLVHHSDRGSQYVGIRYTERLAAAGIEPSVGSVGDSYDNALAETINGLYKAEVIHRRGPWRSFEAVEFATLTWVDWFNNRRLMEPIGNIPPAEAEERYYAMRQEPAAPRPNFGSPAGRVFRPLSRWRAGSAKVIQQRNRRLLADRAMWALFVVVLAPILQFFLGVCKAHEPVSVQALRSEAAIERFDECIVGGLARSREVKRDAALIRPQIQIA
jgi:putative transposase